MLKIKILFTSGMLIFFSGVVNAQKIELFETWFSVEGVGHCHVEVVDIVGHAPGWSSQMRKNSKQPYRLMLQIKEYRVERKKLYYTERILFTFG